MMLVANPTQILRAMGSAGAAPPTSCSRWASHSQLYGDAWGCITPSEHRRMICLLSSGGDVSVTEPGKDDNEAKLPTLVMNRSDPAIPMFHGYRQRTITTSTDALNLR